MSLYLSRYDPSITGILTKITPDDQLPHLSSQSKSCSFSTAIFLGWVLQAFFEYTLGIRHILAWPVLGLQKNKLFAQTVHSNIFVNQGKRA